MTQETSIPRFCPLSCGQTLISVRITNRVIELLRLERDLSKVNLDESYGILCKSCGYATIILVDKK